MPLSHILQHGRSDSYRVATLPNIRDDNKTADGMFKVLRTREEPESSFPPSRSFFFLFIFTHLCVPVTGTCAREASVRLHRSLYFSSFFSLPTNLRSPLFRPLSSFFPGLREYHLSLSLTFAFGGGVMRYDTPPLSSLSNA